MTPCEKLGYKVGDYFLVVNPGAFTAGSIIQMCHDEDDGVPAFSLIQGNSRYGSEERPHYVALKRVRKLSPEERIVLLIGGELG